MPCFMSGIQARLLDVCGSIPMGSNIGLGESSQARGDWHRRQGTLEMLIARYAAAPSSRPRPKEGNLSKSCLQRRPLPRPRL